MTRGAAGLWRHPDFLRLWAGQTVSLVGSAVTGLALPLTAVLVLGATPAQMGVLGAVQYLPFLALGLFAGVWVDRRRRRPLLIAADAGRALLLGLVPPAALLGLLLSVFSLVTLLTAVVVRPLVERLGHRRTLVASLLLTGTGNACVPLAGVAPGLAIPLLLARSVLHGLAAPAFNVASNGLRQLVTPPRLQGRVSGTLRFAGWGMLPLGALVGGYLGQRLGLRPALTVAAAISLCTCLWPLLHLPRTIHPIDQAETANDA